MVLLLSRLHIEDGGGQLHVPCLCRDLGRRLATSDGHGRDDRREAHEERAIAFESGEVSHGFRIAFDRLAELGTMAVPRSLKGAPWLCAVARCRPGPITPATIG